MQILIGLDNLCVIVMSLVAPPRDRTELGALGLAAAKFRAELLGGRGRSYQELRGLALCLQIHGGVLTGIIDLCGPLWRHYSHGDTRQSRAILHCPLRAAAHCAEPCMGKYVSTQNWQY